MKIPVATLVLVVCAAAAGAQTLPLQTEEATTAPRGTLVLEVAAEAIGDEPNFITGETRDRWAAPVLRLVHSPAENVEIDLEWTGRVGQIDDPTFGTVSDWGDVALRAKVRFADDVGGHPAFSARFGVFLPETSYGNGLGPNALRMLVQGLLSKTLGAWSLHGNAGLALNDEVGRPHEQRDFLAYGLALGYRVNPGLQIVGEWAGLAGKGMPGADAHSELRAGLRLGSGRLRGAAAVRRGLLDTDGKWGFTVGAVIHFH
jgi:outer membrane putative beta-barrel porin/alpha-amylase